MIIHVVIYALENHKAKNVPYNKMKCVSTLYECTALTAASKVNGRKITGGEGNVYTLSLSRFKHQ